MLLYSWAAWRRRSCRRSQLSLSLRQRPPSLRILVLAKKAREKREPGNTGVTKYSKSQEKLFVKLRRREVCCSRPLAVCSRLFHSVSRDRKALLVTQLLLRNSNLPPAMVSLSSRILLSIIFSLPQVSPASLSPDLSLHSKVLELAHTVSAVIASGTTSMMNKSLGLMIVASIADGKDRVSCLSSRRF